MMNRKRWLMVIVGGLALFLGLACCGAGAWLTQRVPAVARLVYGEPPSPTPYSTLRPTFTVALATMTVTPAPTASRAPSTATPDHAPTVPPRPTETTMLAATATLTATASPTAALPTSTPRPSPRPRSEWIAFETKRGALGDYEIFVMAPDGSRLTNLTNSWADDLAPVWSPDGERIAFVSFRDTLTGKFGLSKGSIYVVDFDPVAGAAVGEARRITDDGGADGWPTWSPDGQRIAFHSDRSGDWDIWAINLDGTGLTNLTALPGADRYPAWSPDGAYIAFASKREGGEDVWLMHPNGSGAINLSRSPTSRDRYPMWSPDGKKVTFNTNRDGNLEVYMMKADGSGVVNISKSPQSTEGLADWSPDGKRLVLYSNKPGNKDIFVVDLATGRWTNITNDPASDEFCTWSP